MTPVRGLRLAAFLAAAALLPVAVGSGSAEIITITTTRDACRLLPRHVPEPNVEYTPGFDVRGRPVAPADLPGSPNLSVTPGISVAITPEVARRLKLPVPKVALLDRLGKDVSLGKLTLEGDQVYYNGQPLTDEVEAEFAVICRDLAK